MAAENSEGGGEPGYRLAWFEATASSKRPPRAKVAVLDPDGRELVADFSGDGPIDAVFAAINAATGIDADLQGFQIRALTEGRDALGEASVVLHVDGRRGAGRAVSGDIIEAAAQAYVLALSSALVRTADSHD
jgi:2-isopropylmalate synthase